jgi:hypothetical protein
VRRDAPPKLATMPLDPTSLLDAVDRLAERFRALPVSGLRARVPGFESRAAAGLALARALARAAQSLEAPGREPRPMPDAGVFAVGDQIAVAGHDLAAALAAVGAQQTGAPETGARGAGGQGAGRQASGGQAAGHATPEAAAGDEPARVLARALRDVAATEALLRAARG